MASRAVQTSKKTLAQKKKPTPTEAGFFRKEEKAILPFT